MLPSETGPLTFSELLDRTFSIYRSRFLLLVAIAGIPYAIFGAAVGVLAALAWAVSARTGVGTSPSMAAAVLLVMVPLVIVFIVGAILSAVGTTAAVWDLQLGRQPTIRTSYLTAWRRIGAVIVAGILVGLACAAGLILLIIPGIIVWLGLSLTSPIIVAEDPGGVASLSRSWELTSGYRWKILGAAMISGIIAAIIVYAIQIPTFVISAFVFKNADPVWFTVISTIGSILGNVLGAPILAIALCLIYYDARVRKEGFDLQRMLDAIPPAEPAVS